MQARLDCSHWDAQSHPDLAGHQVLDEAHGQDLHLSPKKGGEYGGHIIGLVSSLRRWWRQLLDGVFTSRTGTAGLASTLNRQVPDDGIEKRLQVCRQNDAEKLPQQVENCIPHAVQRIVTVARKSLRPVRRPITTPPTEGVKYGRIASIGGLNQALTIARVRR